MSSSQQPTEIANEELSSNRNGGEGPPPSIRVSFTESLIGKLPVGSRFVAAGLPTSGATATDDVSSAATNDEPKSYASTMRGAPEEALVPRAPEDPRMASLHVKFSASTRFNASDVDTLRSVLAAEAAAARGSAPRPSRSGTMRGRGQTPVQRSFRLTRRPSGRSYSPAQLQRPPSRGRRRSGSSLLDLDSGGPLSGVMRALSGRHRRTHSADSGPIRRSSSSPLSSPHRNSRSSSNADDMWGGRTLSQPRRRVSASASGGEPRNSSGSQRGGGGLFMLSAAALWSRLSSSGSGPARLRRSQSAPSDPSERGRSIRHSRSRSFGSISAESSLGGVEEESRGSGGRRRGRRRSRSRSRVAGSDGEAEGLSSWFSGRRSRYRRSRSPSQSRNRSRGTSVGELPLDLDDEGQGLAAARRGSQPLSYLFSLVMGPPRRSMTREAGGAPGMVRSRTLPTSASIGQLRESRPGRGELRQSGSLGYGPFGSPRAAYLAQQDSSQQGRKSLAFHVGGADGLGLEYPTPTQRGSQAVGPFEAHRPPQLQLSQAPVTSRPVTDAGTGEVRTVYRASGSLPSIDFVSSPTIKSPRNRATSPHHPPSRLQQSNSFPQQRVHTPERQTPQAAPGPPPLRQATGMTVVPRSASRSRSPERGARSRAAHRRFERSATDTGYPRGRQPRSGRDDGRFARSRSVGRKSFAAQRRQHKMSGTSSTNAWPGGVPQSPQPSTIGEGVNSRFMTWLLGARQRLASPEISSPEHPSAWQLNDDGTGAGATPASPSITENGPSNAPKLTADIRAMPVATSPPAPVPTAAAGKPSSPDINPAASLHVHWPETSPNQIDMPASSSRAHQDMTVVDVRDSPLMQIPPSPRRVVKLANRPRPAPLQIPNDSRTAGASLDASQGISDARGAVAQAPALAGSAGDTEPAAPSAAATGSMGKQAQARADNSQTTPEKAQKGGWSQLGRVLGAVLRFRSPSKATPEKDKQAAAAAAAASLPAAPPQLAPSPSPPASSADPSRQGATDSIVINASELPKPAFPVPRRSAVPSYGAPENLQRPSPEIQGRPSSSAVTQKGSGDGAHSSGPAAGQNANQGHPGRSSRGSVMHSVFTNQAQVVFSDDDGVGASRVNGQAANNVKRKSQHSRTKSDVPLRSKATSRPRTATAAGDGASSVGVRPASAGAALTAAERASGSLIHAPTGVPVGRSVSPLGRSIVATSLGLAPGSGSQRGTPVILISALASLFPRRVLVSPLRSPRPGTAATTASGRRAGDAIALVEFDGQSVVLNHKRLSTVSAVRTAPDSRSASPTGHLPRLLRPATVTASSSHALATGGLPKPGPGPFGDRAGHGAVLPGATFTRLMAQAAVGDAYIQQESNLFRSQISPGARVLLQSQERLQNRESLTHSWGAAAAEAMDMHIQHQQAAQVPSRFRAVADAQAQALDPESAVAELKAVAEMEYGRGTGDGVMSTASGPFPTGLSTDMPATQLSRLGRQSPSLPAPGEYLKHRPLWLGRKPAETTSTPLPWLAQPPQLRPERMNATAPAPSSLLRFTSPAIRQVTPVMQQEQRPQTLLGKLDHDEDDTSSLASSTTFNSLREIQPALRMELRRRDLLDTYGPYGSTGTSGPAGISGVTVRTLKREVTEGPYVKLLKPRQLLRNVQPPGPLPVFTRRRHEPAAGAQPQEAALDQLAEVPEAPVHTVQEPPKLFTGGDEFEATGFGRDTLPDQTAAGEEPLDSWTRWKSSPALGLITSDAAGSLSPRQPRSVFQQREMQQEEGDAAGWMPPPATLLRLEEQSTALPVVWTMTAAPPRAGLSPTRLLRMPVAPTDHQPTRRHVNQGFTRGTEEPRYLQVKLMRVMEPEPKSASDRLPGESPPPGLPMRKLRLLDRPQGTIPGIIPADTAGRTEYLLRMLRRAEDRTRPPTGLLGQHVGLPEAANVPSEEAIAAQDAGAMEQGPVAASTDALPQRYLQVNGHPQPQSLSHPQVQSLLQPQMQMHRGPESLTRHAATTPLQASQPRDSIDMTTQSGLPHPRIDIHVHSNTTTPATENTTMAATASPTTTAATVALLPMQYPPQTASPTRIAYGYPVAVPSTQIQPIQQQQQHRAPQQPLQSQSVLMAAAGPGALAGLSALSQLTALASLSQLGSAVVGQTSADDPSLWPDLLETTPESLRQICKNTTARWRQQRAALAQANSAVLRDMDPSLRLEPAQMLGPGPLGEAHYGGMREGQIFGGAGSPGSARMPGGPYPGGPASVPRDDSPGKWLVTRSVSGRVLVVSPTAQEDGVVVETVDEREQRRRDTERSCRRQARAKEAVEGERLEGRGRKGKEAKKKKKSKERRRRRRRIGRHRGGDHRYADSSSDGDDSDSGTSTSSSSSTSTSIGSSAGARRVKKGRRGKARSKSSLKNKLGENDGGAARDQYGGVVTSPLMADNQQPTRPKVQMSLQTAVALGAQPAANPYDVGSAFPVGVRRTDNGQHTAEEVLTDPSIVKPEPGDDFGMDLVERLLQRMVEPDRWPLRYGSSGGLREPLKPAAPAVAAPLADAGGFAASKNDLSRVGETASEVEDKDDGMNEVVSPLARRSQLLRINAQEASSPHARMVDVLHGPETERRAQEVLDRHAALRAKFMVAASNLRAEVSARLATEQRHGVAAAASKGESCGIATEPSPGPWAQGRLAPEPTLNQMAAASDTAGSSPGPPVSAEAGAEGASGAQADSPSTVAPPPALPTAHPHRPPQMDQNQSINIYCTQLVLNPGRGPITVPGLPAYYPAPGPAAWTSLPVTVPSSPPAYPVPHYRDRNAGLGPSSDSVVDPDSTRATYVRQGTQPSTWISPTMVKVSPVATAVWLRPAGGADAFASAATGGLRQGEKVATTTAFGGAAVGFPSNRSRVDISGEEVFPVDARYSPRRSNRGGIGIFQEAPAASSVRVAPGKHLVKHIISSKVSSLDTSPAIMMLSREGMPRNGASKAASMCSAERAAEGAAEELDEEVEEGEESESGSKVPEAPVATSNAELLQSGKTDKSVQDGSRSRSRSGLGSGSGSGSGTASSFKTHQKQPGPGLPTAGQECGATAQDLELLSGVQKWATPPAPLRQERPLVDPPGGHESAAADLPNAPHASSVGAESGILAGGAEVVDGAAEQQHMKEPPALQQPPQRQAALAAELTQLIMEAFQQSGGVISPLVETEGVATDAGGSRAGPAADFLSQVASTAANGAGRPLYLTDAFGATLDSTRGATTTKAVAPLALAERSVVAPPVFLPSTLANAAVPPGQGPTFLQVQDIMLEVAHGAGVTATAAAGALETEILGGLGDWEAQAMAALQGRSLVEKQPSASSSAGQGDRARQQLGSRGGPGLTAAEVLVFEPNPAQQRKLEALRHLRALQEAALAEQRARYQAGLRHFAGSSQPLRPLSLPTPQFQGLLSGEGDNPAISGNEGRRVGTGGDVWKASAGRRSLFRDKEIIHKPQVLAQPTYITGPDLEQHLRSLGPLQQRVHSERKRQRRRWSSRREEPEILPQAAAMLQHQCTFTNSVRGAMRATSASSPRLDGSAHSGPARRTTQGVVTFANDAERYPSRVNPGADAVRSVAAMVAQRFEGNGWDTTGLQSVYRTTPNVIGGVKPNRSAGLGLNDDDDDDDDGWSEDTDPLGNETVCGGCSFPGCPVHGSMAARGGLNPTMHTDARVRAGPQSQVDKKRTAATRIGALGRRGAGQVEDGEVCQRTRREVHREALLDNWTVEMQALNAATSRVEATKKVAVASAQQALAARRERQAAELADMFRLLEEVDALTSNMEQQTKDTKKMMQVLEEEAELRRVVRLNSLLLEAKKLGGLVDELLLQTSGEEEGTGDGPKSEERQE